MTSRNLLRTALWTLLAFVALTDVAHADPASATAFFTAIAAAFKAVPALYAVVAMGAQTLLAKFLAPSAPDEPGIKQRIDTGGDNPISFLMGEVATAGKMVYVNETGGNDNNILVMVVSLAEVPVSEFSNRIWVNGEQGTIDFEAEPEFDPDEGTGVWLPTPGFHPVVEYDKLDNQKYKRQYLWVKFHDGSQTAADPYLTSTFGADPDKPWTNDMIGRGCAYAIVVMRHSKGGIWSGVPTFKFVVRGMKLYDISKDSSMGGDGPQRWTNRSTWTFSENPKVMQYNIIRGITFNDEWIWGGQHNTNDNDEAYQLPASYWLAAIAHCNETVTKADDSTVKRYTAACEIAVDSEPLDIIKELDKCCAGYTTESGGIWKTWCGPPGTSVLSITDDDIVITEEQTDDLFKADAYNGIRATFTQPKEGWVTKDCAPRFFDDLLEEDDGFSQVADLQLPFVTENNQVQRLMRLMVMESRKQKTHNVQLPPSAFFVEEYDVITWTSARNGYDHKKFQVRTNDDLPNCNQQFFLRECDPDDYDWDVEFELPETLGVIKPVRPGALALDFTVSADQTERPSGGRDKPAIRIDWDWGLPDIDVVHVRYEVRRSPEHPKVIAHGTFRNVEDSDRTITSAAFRFKQSYQVRLYAQPTQRWRESDWTNWKDVTLYDIDIPGAPTLTRVSDLADDGTLDFFLDIDWTAVAAEVIYDLKIVSGARTFYRHSDENAYRLPVTSGKSYTVYVRAVAPDGGTKGDWSTGASITVTKKNTAPAKPSGLGLTASFKTLVLSWPKSPDKDYFATRIYRGTTDDFSEAEPVHEKAGTGWTDDGLPVLATRYYWIAHLDRSDNVSAVWPSDGSGTPIGGISGTTTAIDDSDTDGTAPGTPTGLNVIQRTALNGDGKVEVNLVITWIGIANKKAHYVVRVNDGTDFDYYEVKDIGPGTSALHRKKIPAISGVDYSISVAAVSGQGVVGSYTSNFNITASKKAAGGVTAASGLNANGRPGRIVLNWDACPDIDYAYTEVWYATSAATSFGDLTAANLLTVHTGDRWVHDNLGNNVTRYYWIRHVDRSGNRGTRFPTGGVSGVSDTTKRLVNDDIDDGAVDNNKLGPNAVRRGHIQDGEVIFGKIGNNAVRRDHILDGEIVTGKIDSDAVRSTHIKDGEVVFGKIATDAVRRDQIKNGEIVTDKIGPGEVKRVNVSKDEDFNLVTKNLQKGSVTGVKTKKWGDKGNIGGNSITVWWGGNSTKNLSMKNESGAVEFITLQGTCSVTGKSNSPRPGAWYPAGAIIEVFGYYSKGGSYKQFFHKKLTVSNKISKNHYLEKFAGSVVLDTYEIPGTPKKGETVRVKIKFIFSKTNPAQQAGAKWFVNNVIPGISISRR